jgi:hypothetical protein
MIRAKETRMKGKSARVRIRIALAWFAEWFVTITLAAVGVGVAFRLGNMQLEGMPAVAGISLGLMFAFTSLMYNRARAYSEGQTQRRTLRAGELALRGTLAFVLCIIYSSIAFYLLSDSGYGPTPLNYYPTRWLPTLCVVPAVLLVIYAYTRFARAIRLVLHGVIRVANTGRFVRRLKAKRL